MGLYATWLRKEIMSVYFIGAGPGDPELITLKAHRLIQRCPVILCRFISPRTDFSECTG